MPTDFKYLGLSFEPRDLWVGLYWDVRRAEVIPGNSPPRPGVVVRLYFCCVPTLVFAFQFFRQDKSVDRLRSDKG